jgi:hypothetical protein
MHRQRAGLSRSSIFNVMGTSVIVPGGAALAWLTADFLVADFT